MKAGTTADTQPTVDERIAALGNDEQIEAVNAIDGPLLVVAGPGTGKTQLLSLRAANILDKRDVSPGNILCLTYTNAGVEAMRKRLVKLIGRPAYGIEVSTFHSFASQVRTRHPEYFEDSLSRTVVSDMQKARIIDRLLKAIPVGDPLYGGNDRNGVNSRLRGMGSFISRLKRTGLSTDEFRAIQRQTLDFFEYAREQSDLVDIANSAIPSDKETFCAHFEEVVEELVAKAPRELVEPVVSTPGIYVPYALHLRDRVRATELTNGRNTEGFQAIRKEFFSNKDREGRDFKEEKRCRQAISAARVYDDYEAELARDGLCDYDDIISEAISALAENDGLRRDLCDRYRYIQVDEFQDTNGSQLRIVELLTEGLENPNVMVVGDDDQAIMRFQGASVACIGQFAERYHPQSIVLKTNYRSTPSLVALGQEVARQIETRLPASEAGKDIVPHRKDDEQSEFAEHVFEDQESEYFALARDLRERIDEDFIGDCDNPDEAIAVIGRKHSSLQALIPYLRHFDVPFTYVYTSEVSQMEPMQTMLALLRFVAAYGNGRKKAAAAQLPQIVASSEVGVYPSEAVRFAVMARREHDGRWIDALRDTKNKRLAKLYDDLVEWAGRSESAPVRALVHEIAKPVARYYQEHAEENPFALAEFNSGIRALLDFAEGELATAGPLGRTLRLADVMELFEASGAYGQRIDASVSLGHEGAVRLTTAHGSKGLEFDLVYLVDSDDGTWRSGGGSSGYYASNMLDTDESDEDDVRRLLFVALTRARRRLELYRGKPGTVRELEGLVGEKGEKFAPEDLADVIEVSWEQSYALDTPELGKLLEPDLEAMRISASKLNAFVELDDECAPQTEDFPLSQVLCMPQAPRLSTEFGNLVHEFFRRYVDVVLRAGDRDAADGLLEEYDRRIGWLDYAEEEVQTVRGRFARIAESFLPVLEERAAGADRLVTEDKVETDFGSVPLKGFCDLLIIDERAREIEVVDYKTGLNAWKYSVGTGYERQLQFYRLLLENSEVYGKSRVRGCADWFVEPDKDSGELHEPGFADVGDAQIEHLGRLVTAVWHRIRAGAFDTSAFLESEEYAAAPCTIEGRTTKDKKHRAYQRAFEDWLIENS